MSHMFTFCELHLSLKLFVVFFLSSVSGFWWRFSLKLMADIFGWSLPLWDRCLVWRWRDMLYSVSWSHWWWLILFTGCRTCYFCILIRSVDWMSVCFTAELSVRVTGLLLFWLTRWWWWWWRVCALHVTFCRCPLVSSFPIWCRQTEIPEVLWIFFQIKVNICRSFFSECQSLHVGVSMYIGWRPTSSKGRFL